MNNVNLVGFEEFQSTKRKFSVFISLGKSDRFYFGNGFAKKYNLDDMEGLKLFWNRQHRSIAFKFSNTLEQGMIPLKTLSDGSYYINGKEFLGMMDIDSKLVFGKYTPEILKVDDQNVFVIKLANLTK